MKRTHNDSLWYNPAEKEIRSLLLEGGESIGLRAGFLAGDREGQALLASYCRIYRKKL